jgi:hypothetical protein
MCKRITFFLCEWIYSFDGSEFSGGKLSEALFGFDDLIGYNFEIFIGAAFV